MAGLLPPDDLSYIDTVVAWADTSARREALVRKLSKSRGDRCPTAVVPLLGTMPDDALAYKAQVARQTVALWRRNRGIRPMERVALRRGTRA